MAFDLERFFERVIEETTGYKTHQFTEEHALYCHLKILKSASTNPLVHGSSSVRSSWGALIKFQDEKDKWLFKRVFRGNEKQKLKIKSEIKVLLGFSKSDPPSIFRKRRHCSL